LRFGISSFSRNLINPGEKFRLILVCFSPGFLHSLKKDENIGTKAAGSFEIFHPEPAFFEKRMNTVKMRFTRFPYFSRNG